MPYRIGLFLTLMLTFMAARAAAPEALIDRLNHSRSLEPAFQALTTSALARAAGVDRRITSLLEELKPRLRGGRLHGVALAPEAAGVTLRLEFVGDDLNYLALQYNDEAQLAGWYDYALGVSLAELVESLVAQGDDARAFLKRLDDKPLQALGQLPDSREGRILSRLVLAACSGGNCYTTALSRMKPLEEAHTSLWRYEQAVQHGEHKRAARAMTALREELGRDPGLAWLDHARALARGRCGAVRTQLEKAVERWPDYRKLYPLAAQCAAREQDWSATTRWFRALEERFGQQIDFKALADHPVYGDHLESDSFNDWQGDS
jgi:hypothetical protein